MDFQLTIPTEVEAEVSESDASLPIEQQKREAEVTVFVEGPGNEVDGHWYTGGAVESALDKAMYRRKMFLNHKPESKIGVEDWAATILETSIGPHPEHGRQRGRARVKVHDLELWRRFREAPGEIVLSIRGAGSGSPGKGPDGKMYNRIVEKVSKLGSFDFVTYGGNADKGASIIEDEAGANGHGAEGSTTKMDPVNLTEATEHNVRKTRPDLVAAIESSYKEELEAARRQEVEMDKLKTTVTEKDAETAKVKADLAEAQTKLTEAEKVADELKAKEALAAHAKTVADMLEASKMPERSITPWFKKLLEKMGTAEEVKAAIDDRVASLGESGKEDAVKDAAPAKVEETEGDDKTKKTFAEMEEGMNIMCGGEPTEKKDDK